jgi:hypothetical protein
VRDHVHLIIGASEPAEKLRRYLVRTGKPHAGATSHLRGLRGCLAMSGEDQEVTVYVALDGTTVGRHGRALRTLMADLQGRPGSVRSIGLLSEIGLTTEAAEIGCDVYVDSSREARRVGRMLHRGEDRRAVRESRHHARRLRRHQQTAWLPGPAGPAREEDIDPTD